MCAQEQGPDIEQEFVQPDRLHFDLFLPVIGLGQVEQTVDEFCHAGGILQGVMDGFAVLFFVPFFL